MSSFHQGLSAEFLVCADLCKQGYSAFMAAAGLRYDVVVDVGGMLLRVQVKSVAKPTAEVNRQTPTYKFQIATGNSKRISPQEVDIVALVAFDIGVVAYLPAEKCTNTAIKIRPPGASARYWSRKSNQMNQLPFSKALQEIQDEDSKQSGDQR